MNKRARVLSVGALIAGLLVVLVAWRIISNAHAGRDKIHDGPLPVDTAAVIRKPMPVQLLAVGQVQSEHTVNVQPQVSGVLKQVLFTEGQYVHKGQPLFQIDPSPFQAALDSAKAAYLTAKAQADREAPLAAKDYISPQDYQTAMATATQAQAALQQAQINLSYTKIVSPIDGLTGNLAVKAGNVVSPASSLPLVTINQMQPILVQFNIPQNFLSEVRQYQAQHPIQVLITHEDGTGNLGQGKLVFIDNTVNTATGTVMLKAEVPNKNVQLWPGQYVGVTMQLTMQPNAVVIPSTAIQSSEQGNFVYKVVKDVAVVQPVVVNRQIGNLVVISSGLRGGEQVITLVSRNLRPNIKVKPTITPVPAAGSASVALP